MSTTTHHRHTRNVGDWERGARLFIGTAAMGLAATPGPILLKALFAVLGVAGLITASTGYCPLNHAAGRDTYRHHRS